jgi:hypothetical protein
MTTELTYDDENRRRGSSRLLVLALSLTLVVVASSSTDVQAFYGYHWSVRKTQDYLLQHRATSDGKTFDFGRCEGHGPYHRRNGVRLYARFTCWLQDEVKRVFVLWVRPVSPHRAKVVERSCDNSKSDYACP